MTERIDFNALAAQCAQEEARLQFASFSRQDALALGLLVAQSAAQYDAGVAVEITVNGLTEIGRASCRERV